MNTALVIMAAGLGSRFGGGIKQLEPVGPNGEIIMDYSIHDAIEAGFNKVIFIIRKDIEADFREIIGERIEAICERKNVKVQYAFQAIDAIPDGFTVPEGRTKPWGTGQAVLSCAGLIEEPFVVLNADDYYGKEAFVRIHDFLAGYSPEKPNDFCMAGFILKNTLSENGGVTRGICRVDDACQLQDIRETSNIVKTESGAEVEGRPVNPDAYVSMNMWGLTPEFVDMLKEGFEEFFEEAAKINSMKAEYLLPIFIGQQLRRGNITVKVLETDDKWFGVTYKEDKPFVVESFRKLIDAGVYQEDLFSDF